MADLADSTWGEHELALQEDLIALQLEGIASNWVIRAGPWLLPADTKPIGIISPAQERILREGVIGMNDFRLRAVVAIIAAGNREISANVGTMNLWRQKIMGRYHRSTVLRQYGVTGLMGSEVEPGVPQDFAALTQNYDAQMIVVNSRVRLAPTELP